MRVLVWFSCGAPSACAAKLAIREYGHELVSVVYCDTSSSEHEDNERFKREVESWIGHKVTRISSEKYASVDEVFERERFMSSPAGARCTTEMKKIPRFKFQKPDDVHVFGITADEPRRVNIIESSNPELSFDWILTRFRMDKLACFSMISSAGIELPAMYRLGFRNNNCKGCVKATSPAYWNKTRECFPEVFERRAKLSRELGVRLVRVNGERVFLDELEPSCTGDLFENITCGPECSIR